MNDAALEKGEPHPMAHFAFQYVNKNMTGAHVEAIASAAISGNRTADICLATYKRMVTGQAVSDRYILGLAWFLLQTIEREGTRG